MRSTLLIICMLTSLNVWADMVEVLCSACRDPDEFPRDYGNTAYNQVFGQSGWMSLDQADKILITNLNNRWAVVDVNFVLVPLKTSVRFPFLSIEVMVPTEEIALTVFTDTGHVERYRTMISGRDLIVGLPDNLPLSPELDYGQTYFDAPIRDRQGATGSYTFYPTLSGYPGSRNGIVIVGPSY